MYELITGWRYLHRRHRDVIMQRFALVGVLVCAAGAAMIGFGMEGLGALMVVGGMIATALFALLSVLSVFTAVSTLGITLGVAALVVVLAVTTGFQREFRERILGVHAHVIVRNPVGVSDVDHVMAVVKASDPEVIAAGPFSYDEALATRGKGTSTGVAIKGVDPVAAAAVLDIDRQLVEGSFDSLAVPPKPGELPPIIMGVTLAERLEATLGDTLTIVVPFANEHGQASTKKFRVTGIFRCGFDEWDRRLVIAPLSATRSDPHVPLTGIEVALADPNRASDVAARLQDELGAPYEVIGWRALNSNLFQALDVQKVVLVLILMLIILVAAVNVVSALTMMVVDKTGEIAILKSMGSTTRGVGRVFRVVGLSIGGIGTAIGLAIGVVTCYVVDAYGFQLDSKTYMIERLPLEVRLFEVAVVGGLALLISAVATLVPARAAAALRPVDGLRYG